MNSEAILARLIGFDTTSTRSNLELIDFVRNLLDDQRIASRLVMSDDQTRANLHRMIGLGRATGARVLLLGIKLPANYGKAYGEKFHRIYQELADQTGVDLVPFFLEGVAETRALMQTDGIHPAAAAQPRILDNVWRGLAPLLRPTTG